jgi:hypothetical protein
MCLFFWAAFMDITNPSITDNNRILFVFSVMFSLVKIVYLVRVFKSLNFLVTMLASVVNEVVYFMVLFGCFLLTFAECNHIVMVDTSAYNRTPALMAQFFTILRCSMGDFSLIDPFNTFDPNEKDDEGNIVEYRHSYKVMMFTWFIYMVSIFFLYMIFMNFIIAVIGDSYGAVYKYKDEWDYLQRIMMIYEREAHFGQETFADKNYFPDILVVRRKKENESSNSSWQSWMTRMKDHIKQQTSLCIDTISKKSKEQKQHFSNSIKKLENDVHSISQGLDQIYQEMMGSGQRDSKFDKGDDSSSSLSNEGDEKTEGAASENDNKPKRNSSAKKGKSQGKIAVVNTMMDFPTRHSPNLIQP